MSLLVSQDIDLRVLTNRSFGAPYYLDAVADLMRSNKTFISIKPFPALINPVAILNGLEIMKLNDSSGRLNKEITESGPRQHNKVVLIYHNACCRA